MWLLQEVRLCCSNSYVCSPGSCHSHVLRHSLLSNWAASCYKLLFFSNKKLLSYCNNPWWFGWNHSESRISHPLPSNCSNWWVTAPTDSDPPIIFNSKQEGWYKTVHNLVTNMLVTNMRYPVVQNCTQNCTQLSTICCNKYAVPGGTKLYTKLYTT